MAYARETVFIVGLYALCSAGMLIINKLAVYHIGVPSFVTLCQFAVTAGTVLVGRQLGVLQLDPHDWNKIKHFVIYVFAFSAGTWSNMKVLMVANVETIIVFRACSPIVVSFFDYLCYGRAPPSPRSIVAMLTILAGALSYVLNDREFQVQGVAAYTWVAVWFVLQHAWKTYIYSMLGRPACWEDMLGRHACWKSPGRCSRSRSRSATAPPPRACLAALRGTLRGTLRWPGTPGGRGPGGRGRATGRPAAASRARASPPAQPADSTGSGCWHAAGAAGVPAVLRQAPGDGSRPQEHVVVGALHQRPLVRPHQRHRPHQR